MGAKITGENTSTIVIQGVDYLSGIDYSICPDRIEAGTYLVAAAITGGKLLLIILSQILCEQLLVNLLKQEQIFKQI